MLIYEDRIHLNETLVCVQSYLFALFLLTHSKGKKISNLVLGIFLLFLDNQMLNVVLASTGILSALAQVNGSYGYIYGVLFYLYTCSPIYKDFCFNPSCFLLFYWLLAVLRAISNPKLARRKVVMQLIVRAWGFLGMVMSLSDKALLIIFS